jgi:hypothetical protein
MQLTKAQKHLISTYRNVQKLVQSRVLKLHPALKCAQIQGRILEKRDTAFLHNLVKNIALALYWQQLQNNPDAKLTLMDLYDEQLLLIARYENDTVTLYL